MKLCECRIGVLVSEKPDLVSKLGQEDRVRIGHIVGLTKNVATVPEVIPLVLWADKNKPVGMHHANLDLFTAW